MVTPFRFPNKQPVYPEHTTPGDETGVQTIIDKIFMLMAAYTEKTGKLLMIESVSLTDEGIMQIRFKEG